MAEPLEGSRHVNPEPVETSDGEDSNNQPDGVDSDHQPEPEAVAVALEVDLSPGPRVGHAGGFCGPSAQRTGILGSLPSKLG